MKTGKDSLRYAVMTKNDQAVLASLARSREFEALRRLAEEMIHEWKMELPSGETEFQYIKSSLEKDGKILGIDALFKRIDLNLK